MGVTNDTTADTNVNWGWVFANIGGSGNTANRTRGSGDRFNPVTVRAYSITLNDDSVSVVSLPATLPLLAGGFALLGLMRHKAKAFAEATPATLRVVSK